METVILLAGKKKIEGNNSLGIYLNNGTEFTASFWLDVIPSFASWTDDVVPMSKVVAGRGGRDFLIVFRKNTKGSTYISELYINDVSITNESTTGGVSFQSTSKVFGIGTEIGTGLSEEMDITKVGLWNRTLTLTEKTNIYNNGCPTDLSPYSPNTYLKIDDYTTLNGELQFPDSGSAIGTWESLADEADGISTNVPCP